MYVSFVVTVSLLIIVEVSVSVIFTLYDVAPATAPHEHDAWTSEQLSPTHPGYSTKTFVGAVGSGQD